jgi:hypothetical protein
MRNLFKDQQILAIIIIGGVGATMITAWIMNRQSGPAGWIKNRSFRHRNRRSVEGDRTQLNGP